MKKSKSTKSSQFKVELIVLNNKKEDSVSINNSIKLRSATFLVTFYKFFASFYNSAISEALFKHTYKELTILLQS